MVKLSGALWAANGCWDQPHCYEVTCYRSLFWFSLCSLDHVYLLPDPGGGVGLTCCPVLDILWDAYRRWCRYPYTVGLLGQSSCELWCCCDLWLWPPTTTLWHRCHSMVAVPRTMVSCIRAFLVCIPKFLIPLRSFPPEAGSTCCWTNIIRSPSLLLHGRGALLCVWTVSAQDGSDIAALQFFVFHQDLGDKGGRRMWWPA